MRLSTTFKTRDPLRQRRRNESSGYVAILVALMITLLFSMAAFAVDVGNWYLTAARLQKAADAGALAGVPQLPGYPANAYSIAKKFTAYNGYTDGSNATVQTSLDGQSTRLRVTVTTTVNNVFGGLLGIPQTTISRTAVADYAGPVPMGSPCNEFGNDPDSPSSGQTRGTPCNSVTGQFWANVGSPQGTKMSGDAFQDNNCTGTPNGCTTGSGPNTDYDPNGYFYEVTLTQPVSNLVIQAFDPAWVSVGDLCDASGNLSGASAIPATKVGFLDGPKPGDPPSAVRINPTTRYATGSTSPYCTGDVNLSGGTPMATQYTVRNPGPDPWNPLSFQPQAGCQQTFPGRSVPLSTYLNTTTSQYQNDTDQYDASFASNGGYTAKVFRQWVPLCYYSYAPAGTYLVQVKTNGVGNDLAGGHNRFALRAYSTTDSTASNNISISGYNKMAIYANLPNANTTFYLARIPSGAAGQILDIDLYDIGDSTQPGRITVVAPPDSGVTFTNCTGVGVVNGPLTNCSVIANSSFNGKWQTISIQVPSNYTCQDNVGTACWVRLNYNYGSGAPSDTTSWRASIEGDPVRLVE